MMNLESCKICGGSKLKQFAHVAECRNCGTLMFYPYPPEDEDHTRKVVERKQWWLDWYCESSFRNHVNFTNMLRFTMNGADTFQNYNILDYGGGGGQFALVALSHFPNSQIYITDKEDSALLPQFGCINRQILFDQFEDDPTWFDFIFLNDVFEHVQYPGKVLRTLIRKLKKGGKIFIDTPKSFWLYPVLRFFWNNLYLKLCQATINDAHLQIWTRTSFKYIITKVGLKIIRYRELSEFTMPPNYYLKNMKVSNHLVKTLGHLFYYSARFTANNKIMALMSLDD